MIAGLLLLIFANGVVVFWPKPISEFTVRAADGSESKISGEIVKTQLRRTAEGGSQAEIQLFTGNKDAYGLGFRFIDKEAILSETRPEGLMLAERMEYGDALFHPVQLKRKDGSTLPASAPGFQETLQQRIDEGNRLRSRLLHLEKGRIGKVNARIKATELRIKELLAGGKSGTGPEVSALRDRIAREQKGFDTLVAESRQMRARLEEDELTVRLSTGEERTLKTGSIVYCYEPNRLSLIGKLGVFLHHVIEFATSEPREANTEGGIFPAIFGTFVMTILLALLVTPFGVIAAIYLREYASQGLLVRIVRICVNNLAGVPSIVFGVFGLGFFVYGMGAFIDGGTRMPLPPMWWFPVAIAFLVCLTGSILLAVQSPPAGTEPEGRRGFGSRLKPIVATLTVFLGVLTLFQCPYFHGFFSSSLPTPTFGTGGILWASLTLALMTLPVVIVATEEALAAVPRGVREAALACGASKWQTIQRVVLPSALPGVMTGVILAMARGAGEVAPLMITGVVKLAPSLPLDFEAPFIHAERKFMHLGFHIYDLGFQSPDSEAAKPMVFATTLLLILLVVVLNLAAISLRAHLRRKYQASAF
jgi:ABC-type phosphate transport system permease subunit/ABC-type phosphate transport system auxiliary subunit